MSRPDFVTYDALETDALGDGSQEIGCLGYLISIDIVPDESASFDIAIGRVLPDGSVSPAYSATGVTALTTVSKADITPNPCMLAGPVRITLSNAGEHDSAAKVFLSIS